MTHAPKLALLAALTASPAYANMEAVFTESAPKDRFSFTNEIAGATVILETPSGKRFGVFDNTSRAQITGTECAS